VFTQKPAPLTVLGEGRRRRLVNYGLRKIYSSARIFFVLFVFIELLS